MVKYKIILKRSTLKDKKAMVIIDDGEKERRVHFGQKSAKDYPTYSRKSKKEAEQEKAAYIARHSKNNEEWNISDGLYSAGFWALNIFWNKSTIAASIRDLESRYSMNIINQL